MLAAHAIRLALSLVTLAGHPGQAPEIGGSPMFRGDPSHAGISTAAGTPGQGGVRWRVRTGAAVRSSPAATAQRLFVGSGDGTLYALDRSSGRIVWRFRAGGRVDASPAVAEGLVIAATLEGRIFAVNESNGALRWSRRTGTLLPRNVPQAGGWDLWASSPVVSGGSVIIGGGDGGIYCLDLRTGAQRWRVQTGGRVRATPAVHDGLVVVGSWDGRIYAVDLGTGATRWTHRTVGDTLDSRKAGFDRRAVQGSAAVVDGMVFVGSRDGAVYGLDEATGARRWRTSHQGSWVIGSPAVRDGRLYVGSSDGHFLQALDRASGSELWHLPTEANVLGSPLLVGDDLVVTTLRTDAPWGELLAIDPGAGRVRWRLRLEEGSSASVVAAGRDLYLGTEAGEILAVGTVGSTVPELAVYYDSTRTQTPATVGGRLAFEYFAELGYRVLDGVSLAEFFRTRIADRHPSGVVFASDWLPPEVAPVLADTVLLRRYLAAGGKIVAFGVPLGAVARDSAGRYLGQDPAGMEQLLGVPADALDYDMDLARPTALGRAWGIAQVVRGNYPVRPDAVSGVLAETPDGQASAWFKVYRPDRPWSGYVQLWGMGADAERLRDLRAAAEYGLLRAAVDREGEHQREGGQ